MNKGLIRGDIAAAKGKGGSEEDFGRTLMVIGARLLDTVMREGNLSEADAMSRVMDELGIVPPEAQAPKSAKHSAKKRIKGDETAAALNELMEAGELEGEIDDYLADEAFLALLEEFPAKAALRIYAAEKRGKEGEARGERSIIERLRMNGSLPGSEKTGKPAEPQVNFMKMNKRDFERFRKELAKKAGR